VSEHIAAFKRKMKMWIHRMGKKRFYGIKHAALYCICEIFLEHFTISLSFDRYIPFTSKHLTGCKVLLRYQRYRFIVKCNAEQLMICKVDSCG